MAQFAIEALSETPAKEITPAQGAREKPDGDAPTRTTYEAAASSPFSAGATRVPIASMARISFACANDAAFI